MTRDAEGPAGGASLPESLALGNPLASQQRSRLAAGAKNATLVCGHRQSGEAARLPSALVSACCNIGYPAGFGERDVRLRPIDGGHKRV